MTRDERDVERACAILIDLIDLSGMSRREVERRLLDEEYSSTDVTRLLAGKLDLKLRHILAISRLIGLDPFIFFNLLLPEPEPSPLLERLRRVVDAEHKRLRRSAARSPLAGPAEDMDPLRRGVSALIDQLQQFLEEPSPPDAPSSGAQPPEKKRKKRVAQAKLVAPLELPPPVD